MTKKEKERLRSLITEVQLSDDKIEALESLYFYCKSIVK